ncbi:hypothetical protein Nans01_06050 [Nocardiopsis ansamitocini]|uniref:HTH-type transcriptional repressor KstR2 C-terminal domain-containing protein n=2 Tax=Nocardiopsis ansamitocini TaxID=1670832 RepID=A0A9W6P353_9ACTN|nr:hypothetical protein Nans01_06050 [Nocardiopsis ansamitocini]
MTANSSPLGSIHTNRALDAATRLFSAHGSENVDMHTVALAADIDAIDFRRAFPTKLDLSYAVALRCTRRLVSTEDDAVSAAHSPLDRLCTMIRRHITFSWEHRTEQELRRALLPVLRTIYPDRHRELSGLLRGYRARIQGLIEQGRDLQLFARTSREPVTGATVLETLEGILNWYDPDGELTIDQLSDVYVDLVIHHLLGAQRT